MRILITGAKGQLGTDLLTELQRRGIDAVGFDVDEMDITDAGECERVIEEENRKSPLSAIMHCAAWTAVDKAEDEPETVRLVNAKGTENIARVAAKLDLKLLYLSTDYVFDGQGTRPWQPEDERHPLNVYGQTKYEGELAIEKLLKKYFIVRISWVFGVHGNNFIKTMLRLGKENGAVNVVNDQTGSPTYTPDLAVLLCDMIETDRYGIYHATNEGLCTWYDFACEIFKQAGMTSVRVTPVSSDGFKAKAKRPSNSRMSKDSLTAGGFKLLPPWQDALARYLKELGY